MQTRFPFRWAQAKVDRFTWCIRQCCFINSFAEINIDEVETNCFVSHTNLTLLWFSYFHILPLQDLYFSKSLTIKWKGSIQKQYHLKKWKKTPNRASDHHHIAKNVRNNTNPSIKPSTVQWNALKFHSVRAVLTIVLYHANIETIIFHFFLLIVMGALISHRLP